MSPADEQFAHALIEVNEAVAAMAHEYASSGDATDPHLLDLAKAKAEACSGEADHLRGVLGDASSQADFGEYMARRMGAGR